MRWEPVKRSEWIRRVTCTVMCSKLLAISPSELADKQSKALASECEPKSVVRLDPELGPRLTDD